jgi:hypothetical protein
MAEPLPIWVIYQNPTDRPGLFVARKWLLDKATAGGSRPVALGSHMFASFPVG